MEYTTPVLAVLGLAGIAVHNLVKIDSLNRQSKGCFSFWPFVKLEWPSIAISVIVLGVMMISVQDMVSMSVTMKWPLGPAFFTGGYMAQSLLYKWMGRAQKEIDNSK